VEASHIGQFAGILLIFAGGFVALFRLLARSESSTASALAWFGLVAAIISASTFTILQAVDGIALKIAVNTWYAIPPSSADAGEEKAIAFRVAEGLRWTEWGLQAYYRMLQGAVALMFGVAIVKSALLSRWIGAVEIAAGVVTIAAGVVVAYVGFSSVRDPVADLSTLILYPWVVILGIFMWRKTMAKKLISR
jgi:ABC-type amino acid transport substrate-binding protein